jgi:NitT/TauT family transport system permease protein
MAEKEPAATGVAMETSQRTRRRFQLGERSSRILALLSPVLILLLWEIGVAVGIINGIFFPPPSKIAVTFWEMTKTGQIFTDLYVSVLRIIVGFFLGAIPGLIIGLSMGLFRPVLIILRPIVSATYPIPKLALMPLIILIFGFGETQKVVTIALGTFFMVLINTMAGVLNLDKIYLDVAKNFGASRRDFYLRVALPGALPLIFTGVELGMGMALLLIVAAEMQGAISGIGYRIWASQAVFNVKEMFVAFILISILGYVFAELLAAMQRRFVPWKQ